MPKVTCDGTAVELGESERLLDGLLRAGVSISNSCRAGACQSCLVKATRGVPPAAAQVGLKDALRARGYFLACQAKVHEDLEITVSATDGLAVAGRLTQIERIGDETLRVTAQPLQPFPHQAGQFLTLARPDGLARPYSIASRPQTDLDPIELHVRVHPGGRMSNWLAEPATIGAEVQLRGPAGTCCYSRGDLEEPLVLAGTGTGLAPLLGVLRDALAAGHAGPIQLWHGARNPRGLYLVHEMKDLAARHPQIDYRRVVLEGADGSHGSDVQVGRLDELLSAQGSFAGRRVFLCGDPTIVRAMQRRVFLGGAASRAIHADAFLVAPATSAVAAPAAA